ncbi:hypothetical protein ACEWY4_022508 [Coilia grayii]|uniref:DUF5641 domain-containing protein n=1 Tax=Coilia grayii TaxID=363190 RepID=A0ABD1J805_9TELE
MPNLPVYTVKPENVRGVVKTLHRDHLLPVGYLVRLPPGSDDVPASAVSGVVRTRQQRRVQAEVEVTVGGESDFSLSDDDDYAYTSGLTVHKEHYQVPDGSLFPGVRDFVTSTPERPSAIELATPADADSADEMHPNPENTGENNLSQEEVKAVQVFTSSTSKCTDMLERLSRVSSWTTLLKCRKLRRPVEEQHMAELPKERIEESAPFTNCASHAGGVWERQIRTIPNVLNATLAQSAGRLDDASLRTLFYEAMAIVNSRPLSIDGINDPNSLEPLTPNHLILMKSKLVLPPPGKFVKEDVYGTKRWRRIQYLIEQFWSRWKSEYLSNISTRQKWHVPRRNLQVNDVVIIKDEILPRNQWQLAQVVETTVDSDDLVRRVKV